MLGDDNESIRIEPVCRFAGTSTVSCSCPEKGDGVWIEFEAGHPCCRSGPGSGGARTRSPKDATEKVRVITTSHGHQVVLDDDKDELRLEHGNGPSIVLAKDKITIKVGASRSCSTTAARHQQRKPEGDVMPGRALTTFSSVQRPHGGRAVLTTTNTHRRRPAPRMLLETDIHTVVGCTFCRARPTARA